MKIHILGICGTFMGGIALLARAQGHEVTGADTNVYPPMSTMLAEQGVDILQGYQAQDFPADADAIVVGNVMRRGLDVVEHMLDHNLPYTSGPQWLGEHILRERWVLAVAGTHGKTTTASMLAWILEYAGLKPGFLIGGVPQNFGVSARLGDSPFFVVEADEYDTAFFDKRSKFVHYHPRTVILNNLEYDHADIFPDVQAIKTQFHHLMRTVPGSGLAVVNAQDANLSDTLAMGCWTPVETFADGDWRADYLQADGSEFRVFCQGVEQGVVRWDLLGEHNVNNALAAIAAARHAGVPAEHAIAGLAEFQGVKRRMQVRGTVRGVTVYDDFAHHPTAITTTLAGLRAKVGNARIIALLEPRSNTMRMGTHGAAVAEALQVADYAFIYQLPEWDDIDALAATVAQLSQAGDHVLVMSNGGFGGIHDKLLTLLAS
ncbi:UDP-N-acetylmuramate:L-alanyl-gamma-D-glutamyl-meso-diaminopimelate ligase [Thiothrix winogradskyi]|uniref:UDP-N-acetylmuramate--L-alanyl-gamma-D-glutamyl-meso-2,6-diaminoheptandioate ligase n=1 Tax=Thiothrix winogradskyi TaxID=96472 RepID=A0ABY3T6F8_9GAMM|nr:UDP-N-acetylmuramate:L-alanyl-gamma-D-glutamyl-meso-diaminopimelate ligase [Thiothrix winogradskyi]UJS26201.1 UDP-N-acetylmuramate:L-alanyl-gamma-D-glutamyl-meso-diaminopimelate ligase [Thiothrix winogradskyi]